MINRILAGTAGLAAAAALTVAAVPANAIPANAAPANTVPANTAPAPGANATGMSPNSTITPAVISANEKTAFDFFVAQGYTKRQAAGIVGNLDQESGMDPTIKQYGGGPGRGIAQWSVGGRWDTYSGDNEVNYTNNVLGVSRYNLNGQLKFVVSELNRFSNYGKSQLQASTTINGAVIAFQDHYEGCGDCNTSARESYASKAYAKYAG